VRLGQLEEAVKGNLEGRRRRVILRADGWKLASARSRRVNRTDNWLKESRLQPQNTRNRLWRAEANRRMSTYSKGQIWGALRKAWKGYKIAKVQHDTGRMKEYATKIKTLQNQLGVPQASFPDLGV